MNFNRSIQFQVLNRNGNPRILLSPLCKCEIHCLMHSRYKSSTKNIDPSTFSVVTNCSITNNSTVKKWCTYILRNSSGALTNFLPKSLSIWFWLFPFPLPAHCIQLTISELLHYLLSNCVILPSAWRDTEEMCAVSSLLPWVPAGLGGIRSLWGGFVFPPLKRSPLLPGILPHLVQR